MSYFDNCRLELLTDTIKCISMSDEEYFTSPVYIDYVSNSKLKLINPAEGGSPELFLNPPKQGYNGSLEFGSAIHELVLQPDNFGLLDYEDKPGGKLGLFIDNVYKNRNAYHMKLHDAIEFASKDADYYYQKMTPKILRNAIKKGLVYYLDKLNNNIIPEMPEGMEPIVLSNTTLRSVIDCMTAYEANSPIKAKLEHQNFTKSIQSFNELAVFATFRVTLPDNSSINIPFKGKIDNFQIDPESKTITLNDLKTTSHGCDYFMGCKSTNDETGCIEGYLGSFQKMHYYRQLAAYMIMLQNMYKDQNFKYYANILAIESKAPYNSAVFRISNSYLKRGINEFKELMCRVAYLKLYGTSNDIRVLRITG